MDINVDQGSPKGDLGRFSDGKYLYKNNDGKFDIDKFNRDFDQYKVKRKDEMNDSVQKKLDELNKPVVEEAPYNLPVGEIAIKTKDSIFNIIDDLLNFNFSWEVLTKDHRLFYLGIFLVFIAILVYMYSFFMSGASEEATGETNSNINQLGKIIHIHEIKMSGDQLDKIKKNN